MNPFIAFYEDPVAFLTALGYALLLVTLLFVTLGGVYRNAITVKARWDAQRPQMWKLVPPVDWLLRVAAIPFVLMLDAWALAALFYLLG